MHPANDAVVTEALKACVGGGAGNACPGGQFGNGHTTVNKQLRDDLSVDVIEGQWESVNPDWSTNLDVFNRITGTTNTTEAVAATQVPTGLYATRRGYTDVSVRAANPVAARGRYTAVVVEFRKARSP